MAPTQSFKARPKRYSAITDKSNPNQERRDSRHSNASAQHRKSSHSPESGRNGANQDRTRKRRRHHVERKLKVSADREASSSERSCDSDLDLKKPLHAIGEHMNDRRTMVSEMFRSLRNDTLMRMIPHTLRELSLVELEEKCIFELEGLSRKRVRAILTGQDVVSSSGTDDSADEDGAERISQHNRANISKQDVQISTATAGREAGLMAPGGETRKSPSPTNPSVDSESATSVEELCIRRVEPTEMELVELELRAQALRVLMQQLDEEPDPPATPSGGASRPQSSSSKPGREMSSAPRSSNVVTKAEKDLFEIHVDEDELAEFL